MGVPTVQIGPRESQGWLLGMRLPQIALVTGALLAASMLINRRGLAQLAPHVGGASASVLTALSVVLWLAVIAGLLAVAFIPVKGRYLDQYVPVAANFIVQRLTHHDTFRGGIFRMAKNSTAPQVALPGDLAHLRFLGFDTGTGEEVCIVKDPRTNSYTAVLVVQGDTFSLKDSAEQAARVEAFGALQTRLGHSTSMISRLQVVERTEPDSGESLVRDFRRRGVHDGSFHAAAYEQLVQVVPSDQQAHETYVAVTLDGRKATGAIRRNGGGDAGAAGALLVELRSIATDLEAAGVRVEGWCPPRLLGFIIRTAYDPGSRSMIEHRGGAVSDLGGGDLGLPSGVDLAAAGPMHAENHWGYYKSDSAYHRCWWIAQWPRKQVQAGFLMPLLLASSCRRAVSWVMEPVPVDRAKRKLDRKLGDANVEGRLRDRVGRRTTRHHIAETSHLDRREEELTAGYGTVRMIGFISTTAESLDELETQSAEIERLAQQSEVEVTRLWGEHDQAFAVTALPLGRGLR